MQVYQAAFGLMPAVMLGLTVGAYAVAAANIHYVYGWAGLRFYAFPLLFFLIALPLPSFLYTPLVNGLQQKVAIANVEILNLIGIPAHRWGSLIQLPNRHCGREQSVQRDSELAIDDHGHVVYRLSHTAAALTPNHAPPFGRFLCGGRQPGALALPESHRERERDRSGRKSSRQRGLDDSCYRCRGGVDRVAFRKLEKRLIAEQARIEAKLRPAGVIG